MGQYDTEEWDEEQQDESQDGNPNSSAMRQLRAADRAKAKRIKELEDQLSGLTKTSRERSIKDVLNSRGLNPKIAVFIPQNLEPTEESVEKWLEEYGEVFGVSAKKESAPSAVAPGDIASMRQMDSIMNSSTLPAGGNQVLARIQAAGSKEELDRIILGGQ